MQHYPDVATVRLGPFTSLSIGAPELVREVLVTNESDYAKSYGLSIFARPILGEGLLTSEGSDHRRARLLLAPAFAPHQLEGYATTMSLRAQGALASICEPSAIDVDELAMRVALEIAAQALLGAEMEGQASEVGPVVTEALEALMGTMTTALPLPPMIPTFANVRLRRAVRRLDQLVYRIIASRRVRPVRGSDVLSLMLSARDEEGRSMSDRQVRDEVMTFFLAGHETTAVALLWALVLLARHPHVRECVEAELERGLEGRPPSFADAPKLDLLLRVIKESMRLFPPVYMLGRRALRKTSVGGHVVRRNQVVLINTYGMHRRADLFPDPERFDPDRFKPEVEAQRPRHSFLPFGAGPRVCIGSQFALLEAQMVLATWLQRFRFDLVAPNAAIELNPLITLRARGAVRMTVTPRRADRSPLVESAYASRAIAQD